MPAEPPVTSPATLPEALALLAAEPDRVPIAGGTDLMVRITGEIGDPPARVVDLDRLDVLRGIRVTDDHALAIGALSTWTEIRRSAFVLRLLPALAAAAATIGAVQIQNRGTLGGNVINASPAGDSLPVLLAADARLVLASARGERSVAAADFWTGYRVTARTPDELLVRVEIPLPEGRSVSFRKVGTRRAQAISKVVMALAWRVEDGVWRDVRIALGSVAPTPVRVTAAEQVLEGAAADAATAERAVEALMDAIRPIDDVRSTATYRREVAGRILVRLMRDAGGW